MRVSYGEGLANHTDSDNGTDSEVSGGREFHPPALPKPDVSLSTHPAPVIPLPHGTIANSQ